MTFLDSLNDLQRKIAMDTEGAKLVTAGAGSGKTRLLTNRICYLISEKHISPNNILAITFTNKATNEMKERIERMVPFSLGVTIKTFHALCSSILRENISQMGDFDRFFSIYDDSEQNKILKKVIKELNVDEDIAKNCSYHISKAKNAGLSPQEYLKENPYELNIEDIVRVYSEYQIQLKNNNALDFDDLLLKTLELFYSCPNVLKYYEEKFKYIHVDEFQDTNLVQYKILKLLAQKYRNVFVVGDEDQCIYCWRGANIENINNFIHDFEPTIYKLEQNYRSTKNILSVANKLIKNNSTRLDKTLFTDNDIGEEVTYNECYDDNEEAEYVANKIHLLSARGVNLKEVGVLMRVSALSRLIEEKLLNYNIPYKTSGIFKFFERLEVKNILAYLTMMVNPKDNSSVLRIINYPKRGIGQATIDKLVAMSETARVSLVEMLEDFRSLDINTTIKNKIADFVDIITEMKKEYATKSLSEYVEWVIDRTGVKDQYNTKTDEDIDRLMNIDQLIQSVKSYEHLNPDANLIDYLESVTLQTTLETEDDDLDSVSISTIHASKGLEFNYVFVIGLEEGRFPLSRCNDSLGEMEEERRLMYVAITRARAKLYLTRAKSRFMYGKRDIQMPSRFIEEMGLKSTKNKLFEENYSSCVYGKYDSNSGNNYKNYDRDTYSTGIRYANSYNSYDSYVAQNKQMNPTDMSGLSNLQGLMTKKVENQKKSYADYKVGVQVLHARFGVGTIVKVENSDDNNYVSIDFGKLGVKTLSLNFAPLQILKK